MNDQINLNQEALVINFVSPIGEVEALQGGDDKNYRIKMNKKTFGGIKLKVESQDEDELIIRSIRYRIGDIAEGILEGPNEETLTSGDIFEYLNESEELSNLEMPDSVDSVDIEITLEIENLTEEAAIIEDRFTIQAEFDEAA